MRIKLLTGLLLLMMVRCDQLVTAQELHRYNCEKIDISNGLLQNNVIDLAFDQHNFAWLSFANGIQKFDGRYCTPVGIQTGLPDNKWAKFYTCANGNLFIAHAAGVSQYNIQNNRFALRYTNQQQVAKAPVFLGEADQILYILTADAKVIGIQSHTGKLVSTLATTLPNTQLDAAILSVSDNCIGGKVALLCRGKIYLWNLKQQQLIFQSPELPDVSPFLLHLENSTTVYYGQYRNATDIMRYDFAANVTQRIITIPNSASAFRCNLIHWQGKDWMSWFNELYATDSTLAKGAAMVNLDHEPFAGKAVIAKTRQDRFGNLYLITINDGLRKIYPKKFPIRHYATADANSNYIVSILPDKTNNRILMGAFHGGLLVFDSMQRLQKQIRHLPGEAADFTPNCIIKQPNGNYLLMVISSHFFWEVNSHTLALTPIPITSDLSPVQMGPGYFANSILQDEQQAILQAQGRLYYVDFTAKTVREKEFVTTSTMSGIAYRNQFVTHTNDALLFYDPFTLQLLKRTAFTNTAEVRCFLANNKAQLWIGSNNGIFQLDATGQLLRHLNKASGLPDECVYAMALDGAGNLWCSTNQGIIRIKPDGHMLHIPEKDGLQGSEFNTNAVATATDGELFFGGTKGANSFHPAAIRPEEDPVQILATRISFNNQPIFNDTAAWALKEIDLPHDHSALSFDFVAMGARNQRDYVYQYKMEGVDKEWIQTKELQTIHYLLQPGQYQLKVYAALHYDPNATALTTISISIHPPYWKSWWFLTLLGLLFVGIGYLLINSYNKRKFEKKIALMESERKIQMERERISRDLHDNIGAYANAVIYNTELLQQEQGIREQQQLMEDLRFASKDIITSLRETIWALKKEQYSAQECLVRIRNFVQPFNRYYEHLQLSVQGEAPTPCVLHCTHALNVVRIVQEAVANAIKHADANYIDIISNSKQQGWEIIVTDNGPGFNLADAQSTAEGNGLNNMQLRATESNFIISIDSTSGTGTIVNLLIPVDCWLNAEPPMNR